MNRETGSLWDPPPRRNVWLAAASALWLGASAAADPPPTAGWSHIGADAGGSRYSPLADINRETVSRLEVAWSYRHGDYHDPGENRREGPSGTAFEATPILVEGRLVFSTPYHRVIALDPDTGAELWVHDPRVDRNRRYSNGYVTRGVAYWRDSQAQGFCAGRILNVTIDSRLIALDVATGRPCPQFGKGGSVDLHVGLERLLAPEHHKMTSPPIVVGDVIVAGASLADMRPDQPSGDVRGYDARNGRLRWRFHVIPGEGEPGVETWESGSWREGVGANPWTPLSADLDTGIVFVATSTASPDFYGGRRPGNNLYANSLLALRAESGELLWHRQLVHHDLWDYDLASPPNLVWIRRAGRSIAAVAQLTKMGLVFVFDRATGEPLFPIEERPVPRSDVAGEWTSPTQPFPQKPPSLVLPAHFSVDDVWGLNPEHLERCRTLFRGLRYEGLYTPPSERGTLVYPSPGGGANWGGGSYDPESGTLYVPSNNFGIVVWIEPEDEDAGQESAAAGLPDSGPLPAHRRARDDIFGVDQIFCNAPPWGYLVAVDVDRGEILWRVPVGRDRNGVEGLFNMGHALVTAGGLVFHGGTEELSMRAHDSGTGEVLATFEIPASLNSGPMTYKLHPDGKQYLVIAPGGHHNIGRLNRTATLGDWIVAYALGE